MRKSTKDHPRRGFSGRHAAVILTAATGLCVTAFILAQLRMFEQRSSKDKFLHQAYQRADAWITAIEDRLSALDSLDALYASSDYVTRDEFHSFVNASVLRYVGMEAVLWAPRVSGQTRYEHEQQARRDGIETYRITGPVQDSSHEFEPVAYFPIYYVEPLPDSPQGFGFDLGSDPSWRDLLDRAAAEDAMRITTRMRPPGGNPDTRTFSVIQPVYRHDNGTLTEANRRENLQGFIIGVLDLGMVAESALAPLAPAGIDVELLDMTAGEPRDVYHHATRKRSFRQPGTEDQPHRDLLVWEKPLSLGGERWVIRCSATPAFSGNGHFLVPLGSLAIGLLATFLAASHVRGHQSRYEKVQRLVAENTRELGAQKDLLSHVLANIPAFVFWKDRNSTYLGCNEIFARSAGVNCPENIVGKTDYDLVWKDNAEAYRRDDGRVMDSGEPLLAFEETQTTKEGSQITLLTSKVPLRNPSGAVVGVLGVYLDITERKLAAERQAALLAELESVNRELKDFAHIVSHDLKAPLRGIRMLAEWMMADLGDRLGAEGKEQVQLLMGRTDRMQNLIHGVLEYSRIGRVREEHAPIHLKELISQVVEDLSPPGHISFEIEDHLPIVHGEPTRIRQLFQNLLSNAIKYMDKDRGLIRVGCEEQPDSWRFFVADNGPGIEEKHFDRIFQIFQTLAPRDETESTGVGLTVAKKIVECHGGRIWVESQIGEGATFFFTLPKAITEIQNADAGLSAAH